MTALPLLTHASPGAPLAYQDGRVRSVRRFLQDTRRLAARLPPGAHVLNLCADRYHFAVGLAAALLTRRISLLPATHTPAVLRELRQFAPDVFCLTDDPQCAVELPRTQYLDAAAGAGDSDDADVADIAVPLIDADQIAAYVFTSGSTGAPVPHRKTWGRLVQCVRAGAQRLGLLDHSGYALLATVPAQHMYGFESSVLLALQSGQALCAGHPFYPADIGSMLAALPAPRALICTPVHLRALLASGLPMPAADLLVSATAPLSQQLAAAAEQCFGAPLLEIYGSTETGQIATRRTANEFEWLLWPDLVLREQHERTLVEGGHLEQPTPLADVVQSTGPQRFLLHGRTADLVNVAGKRSSIGYLNYQLQAIAGVTDGTFFLREAAAGHAFTGVARLGALVVATGLDAAALTAQLRERIDPAFLPRPLLFVPSLPRNSTGKLTQEALEALLATLLDPPAPSTWCIAPDHPCLPGHFPGHPLVPGVLLLDEALSRAQQILGTAALQLSTVKFISPAHPGEVLTFEHERFAGGLRFSFRCADRIIATGAVAPQVAP